MEFCSAVLLDTVAIQEYVFRSNKLSENIGASFLVDDIFVSILQKALGHVAKVDKSVIQLNQWRKSTSKRPLSEDGSDFDIGFIGGGNALLFFRAKEQAQEFITTWSALLLIEAPGLKTAVAHVQAFPCAPEKFKENMEALSRQLQKNKKYYLPTVLLPRHGITAECARSGLSAEIYNSMVKEFVSSSAHAAIAASQQSKDTLEGLYLKGKENDFRFPLDLEDLGGVKGEDSHIAIVHVDGNGMGRLFRDTENLETLRQLSLQVDSAIKDAFTHLIETITTPEIFEKVMQTLGKPKQHTTKPCILPLRPIILGGDDLTFVCDGKLGLYFAQIILHQFETKIINGKNLTACAGIAVIRTKYPFYRGYRLAEALCANAKKEAALNNPENPASFLDFQICLGDVAGDLEQVRANGFGNTTIDSSPNLLFRPYTLSTESFVPTKNFDKMLQYAAALTSWPQTKLNDLREALYQPEARRRHFVKKLEYRSLNLPKVAFDHLFEGSETPYFDMLEICRFYPEFALNDTREQ